jgi:hypothetical protein
VGCACMALFGERGRGSQKCVVWVLELLVIKRCHVREVQNRLSHLPKMEFENAVVTHPCADVG